MRTFTLPANHGGQFRGANADEKIDMSDSQDTHYCIHQEGEYASIQPYFGINGDISIHNRLDRHPPCIHFHPLVFITQSKTQPEQTRPFPPFKQ